MGEQYRCRKSRRRDLVADSALNGIDYAEVLDTEAPSGSPRQRTLLVRCLKPVELGAESVAIEGGVRITPVGVLWAAQAAAVPDALVTPEEQAFFASLPEPETVLVVRTSAAGDYSTYRLRLIASAADPASFDFDPELTEVDFTFKAECPSEFDCKLQDVCPPARVAEPAIDYLARDYASYRRLLLDRISALVPGWRERSPADLGVALVELLAYAGDHLSYYQDAVGTEAYLGTARSRVSVRRHARLLDYRMHDGCNARAWVTLEVEAGSGADGSELPAGRELLTRIDNPSALIDPAEREVALRQDPEVFETLHPLTLHAAHSELVFYTWGDDECCLPRGATRATLRADNGDVALEPGHVLILEERLGPASGRLEDADPSRRHGVRLTEASPETDPVTGVEIVRIAWHEADALPFPLCLSVLLDGDEVVPDVSVARGNVVLADHGRRVSGETLDPPLVSESGRYRPRLRDPDLTLRVPYEHANALGRPAAEAMVEDPRAARPWLSLDEEGLPWHATADLLASDRFAREFVVEIEEDGSTTLRFGDGVLGRRPAPGATLLPTYRVGRLTAGNLGADALAHLLWDQDGVTRVRNPLPGRGGVERESIAEARLYAPAAFRTQRRAVTQADYAAMAEDYEDVQRAVATRRWTGSWYTMFVTVDRFGGRGVDSEFENGLRAFLERFRLAGQDLEIDAPRYVPLDIAMTVCVHPDYFRADVERAVLDALGSSDLPEGRGFFHPDNFTFGLPLYLSRLVARTMEVPGVVFVDVDDTPPKENRFQRLGEEPRGEVAAGRIAVGRLEIIRMDNDPSVPENGRLSLSMTGGR